ncbi:MAG TPA: hypothetical protein VHC69_32845 [Polyangiaceae bacterium]|nr:hypothetical protein [Polyangiaceae bacterium]
MNVNLLIDTAAQLASLGRFEPSDVEDALEALRRAGRVTRDPDAPEGAYRTSQFFVPVGAASGWEAAVFDHFHAVVRTICEKLRRANESALPDRIGGSTYSFEIWEGHPFFDEVMGHLRRFREAQSGLRERVRAYNATCAKPAVRQGVTVYAGQTTWDVTEEGDESNA